MSDSIVIRCEGLVHVYPDGTRALDGIDLEIGSGEGIVLTGANGAGKTTLVRHWNGLLRPTKGALTIEGHSAAGRHVAALARLVGITFQDPSAQLFAPTCRAEVAFGARNVGRSGRELATVVMESLDRVGLADRAGANPYDLGPSKRRLLALASVLGMQPAVTVLDEPTIGLDDAEVAVVAGVLRDETANGRTVVAISHDARLLQQGGFERQVTLDAGRIVGDEVLALT